MLESANTEAAARPATLPEWLQLQARMRADGVALRHKRLGLWQARCWEQTADEVGRLAAALRARGFGHGATLAILSRPRPEALLAALAAQWLGGVAALFDPLDEAAGQIALLRELQADWLFAEGLDEIERLRAGALTPALVLYADARGVDSEHPARLPLVEYADLLAQPAARRPPAQSGAGRTAFAFYRRHADGAIEHQLISHAELLEQGRRLVRAERLDARDEALAARVFASAGQARHLLAPWLVAGFRLNFPENLATRDNDRRELGPTLLAGTGATYDRLHRLAQARLPHAGSWRRRLVDWALADRTGLPRRTLGHWLVRRPLRDVLGLSRVRAPLLVGAPLSDGARAFFAALGVELRAWPDPARWRRRPASAAPPDGRRDNRRQAA